jgi:hypothetical protein
MTIDTLSSDEICGAPVRRSNRPLTQFAVREVEDFLLGKSEAHRTSIHNTTIDVVQEDKRSKSLFVRLHGETILALSISLPDEEVIHTQISLGTTFTADGCPTKTTVERLNGLLDCLGTHGVIPEKVRIFRDPSGGGSFFFGKGEKKTPVGQRHARNIVLKSDPDELLIESSDVNQDWEIMKKKMVGGTVTYEKNKRLASRNA